MLRVDECRMGIPGDVVVVDARVAYLGVGEQRPRAAVLDIYFTDLTVEKVEKGAGWTRIEGLSELW